MPADQFRAVEAGLRQLLLPGQRFILRQVQDDLGGQGVVLGNRFRGGPENDRDRAGILVPRRR